jgi:hypothetical protein
MSVIAEIIDTLENKVEKLILKIKAFRSKQPKLKIEQNLHTSYKLNQMRLKR